MFGSPELKGAPLSSSSSDEVGHQVAQYRHKEPTIRGQALFVKSGKPLAPSETRRLVADAWGLPAPNLVVNLDAGGAHPATLVNKLLLDKSITGASFEKWRASSAQQVAQRRARAASEEKVEVAEMEEDVINELMLQKLTGVFAAVLDAAKLSNNWILVDRTTSSSATAELLLELAIEQTNTRPTIVVVDSVERLRAYDCDESAAQVAAIDALEACSRPLVADGGDALAAFAPLYEPSDFKQWASFVGRPPPCEPDPAHVREDVMDEIRATDSERARRAKKWASVVDKRKWMYYYQSATFGSGTHYVFLRSPSGGDTFPLEAAFPMGSVVAHGGTMAYKRIRAQIQTGNPMVMLYNSGGVTQAFASLHRAMLSDKAGGGGGAAEARAPLLAGAGADGGAIGEKPEDRSGMLLSQIEFVSTENWVKTFGLPEIMVRLCPSSSGHARTPLTFLPPARDVPPARRFSRSCTSARRASSRSRS